MVSQTDNHDSVCIISIARLRTLTIAGHTQDPTWDDEAAATWSIIELNLGIICGCLPMLKPLLANLFPSFVQTVNSQRYATGTFSSKAGTSRAVEEREPMPKGSFQVMDEGEGEGKVYATSTEELWVPMDDMEKGKGKAVA
jgi:Fungal rhodopsin domain